MIPVANNITQIDDLPSIEDIEFSIGDPRAIMCMQADNYSDVSTAIIREYSTNAYDAHVMAGHRDPIEVTLPSMMSPEFVVKDHGIGMSIEDFRQIYTRFGTSNKRHSNDLNGQLGIGSKSGVAYTTSFQVTSVKDGIKNVGVVQRKPDWTIILKVVETSKTSEPNGTEIRIPVHNWQEFATKANDFYKFWLPGRVLVNGKEPNHAVGQKIVDNLYYSEQWNQSYVVMGNVPYRIENPSVLFYSSKMNSINFVAYVDEFKVGDGMAPVEFTPSRESLKYTDRTKATLQKVVDEFAENIVKVAQEEIDAAKTHWDAYVAWSEWTSRLGRNMFSDLTFNGDAFESHFTIKAHKWSMGNYRGSVYSVGNFEVDHMDRTLVVTEFDVTVSSNSKAKAKEYAALKGYSISYVLFTMNRKKDIKSPWISKEKFVTWADLKAAIPKKVRSANSNSGYGGRIPGSFDYYTQAKMEYEKPVPANAYQNDNLFFISVQDSKRIGVNGILTFLKMDDAVVILLGANRLNKFKRDWPLVKDFYKHVRSLVVVDGPTLLSDDAKAAMDVSYDLANWLDKLPVKQLDDPEWGRVNDLRKNMLELTLTYQTNLGLANKVGMGYNVKQYAQKSESFGLLTKYSLLKQFGARGVDHALAKELVVYINAKYNS